MGKLSRIAKLNRVKKMCAVFLLWATTAISLPAQTTPVASTTPVFTTIYNFPGPPGGAGPNGLVQAANGDLYGTTGSGGTGTPDDCGSIYGCGIAFNITPAGALTTIYSFCTQHDCPDGFYPSGALVQGTDGNFYGTTGFSAGGGTVFKVTPSGVLTTLYNFCPQSGCPDGYDPAGLVQGADWDFYGTTYLGGQSSPYCLEGGGCGTVFKITPDGTLTILHNFGGVDGGNPEGALVQGTDGNFYGTTQRGGGNYGCTDYGVGCGTVFKITPAGTLTTLYSFCSQYVDGICIDGFWPYAGLAMGLDGSFYGTTYYGGNEAYNEGEGTIFKITPSGELTTLYVFGNTGSGSGPEAALTLGNDGNFYGTTVFTTFGGGSGTIFQMTPSGTLTTLHEFDLIVGNWTTAALIQDTNGTFYGTTAGGGAHACNGDGCGTVYSLSVGLRPFVKTNPAAGKVGSSVGILGTDLTGATGVKFNGTETAFRLISSSFIEAKVPSGATTGKVILQLPGGTLSSNVPFIVLR